MTAMEFEQKLLMSIWRKSFWRDNNERTIICTRELHASGHAHEIWKWLFVIAVEDIGLANPLLTGVLFVFFLEWKRALGSKNPERSSEVFKCCDIIETAVDVCLRLPNSRMIFSISLLVSAMEKFDFLRPSRNMKPISEELKSYCGDLTPRNEESKGLLPEMGLNASRVIQRFIDAFEQGTEIDAILYAHILDLLYQLEGREIKVNSNLERDLRDMFIAELEKLPRSLQRGFQKVGNARTFLKHPLLIVFLILIQSVRTSQTKLRFTLLSLLENFLCEFCGRSAAFAAVSFAIRWSQLTEEWTGSRDAIHSGMQWLQDENTVQACQHFLQRSNLAPSRESAYDRDQDLSRFIAGMKVQIQELKQFTEMQSQTIAKLEETKKENKRIIQDNDRRLKALEEPCSGTSWTDPIVVMGAVMITGLVSYTVVKYLEREDSLFQLKMKNIWSIWDIMKIKD